MCYIRGMSKFFGGARKNNLYRGKARKSQDPDYWRKAATWGILACMALVTMSVIWGLYEIWDGKLKLETEKIATDYYETYFYPKLASSEKGAKDFLEKYTESGLAPVPLRQLLLFDNARHQDSRPLYETEECNTNNSLVLFYPKSPFGKKDYRIDIKLSCENN